MHDIDFLPPAYHQQNAKRQVQPWRIVVVTTFALLLAAANFAQYSQRSRAARDLKTIEPCYEETTRLGENLRAVQAQLEAARCDALWFTYLRHPWPRSQLLRALVAPLPPEITLQQVLIGEESRAEGPAAAGARPGDRKPDDEKTKHTPPSQRDLQRLRDQCDAAQTLVRVTGTTTETAALYRYLNALGTPELFAKAELRSIESLDVPGAATLRFQLVLTARPGYGQPGGYEGKPGAARPARGAMTGKHPSPAGRGAGGEGAGNGNRLIMASPFEIPLTPALSRRERGTLLLPFRIASKSLLEPAP